MTILLEQFDSDKTAIIEPSFVVKKQQDFPTLFVSSFSHSLIESFSKLEGVQQIATISSSNGKTPVYQMNYQGEWIGFYMSPIGSAACTVMFEQLIEMGLKKLVLFGTCGVLDSNISYDTVIIPSSAFRDEGTSYHYLKPSTEVKINSDVVNSIQTTIQTLGYTTLIGKTWTTDAPYRETSSKTALRKSEGAITVEMECSAMAAVAEFREIIFGQFLYSSDNLDATQWKPRGITHRLLTTKQKFMVLAIECVLNLR